MTKRNQQKLLQEPKRQTTKTEDVHGPEEGDLIADARVPEEQTKHVRAPGQPNAVVRPPDEPTEYACVLTFAGAPDELIELAGGQVEPTEVTQVTKAPNIKPEVAHAPDEEELNAAARAPEELLDINEALQQMKEIIAEARPDSLSELNENISEDVRNFQEPTPVVRAPED